jgi:hypothetical protein
VAQGVSSEFEPPLLKKKKRKKKNIRKDLFGSQFQSIVLGSFDSRPMVRQNIMVAGTCGRHYSPHGRMADRKQREGDKKRPGTRCPKGPLSPP